MLLQGFAQIANSAGADKAANTSNLTMECASGGSAAGAWKGEAMQPKLKLAPEQVKKPKERDTTPSVWNPNWKYKPGGTAMDLAEKFKRIRKQMIEDEQAKKMRRVK